MFRYRLQQFMYGRYGTDQFNFALIILSLVLSIVLMFFGRINIFIRLLFSLPIYFAIYRMFSRNIERRRAENAWFMRLADKLHINRRGTGDFYTSYANGYDARPKKVKKDKKNYKYFTCPSCSAKLRVPKGKGKITVTCPKCRVSFKGKS